MYPVSLKLHRFPAGCVSKPLRPKRYAVAVVRSGCGTFDDGDTERPLRPGCCIPIAPSALPQRIAAGTDGLELYWLQLRTPTYAHGAGDSSTPANRPVPFFPARGRCELSRTALSRLEQRLKQLRQQLGSQGAAAALKRQALLYEVLAAIAERSEEPEDERGAHDAVREAIRYMQTRYPERLYAGELAARAGMTPSSFCRAFKKSTGLTPVQYLTDLRLAKAERYMERGSLSVKEIAHRVGFDDELYFSRVFKKTKGMPPTAYLRGGSRRIAVVGSLFLQDHLLALGVPPVAAPSIPSYYPTPSGFPSYLHRRLAGTKPLNAERGIPWDDVLRVNPDLVIACRRQGAAPVPDRMRQVETADLDWTPDWTGYQRRIGGCLQRERAAERVIRDVARLEARARDELRGVTRRGTWAVIRVLPGDCRVYGRTGHALSQLFYDSLGFEADDNIGHEAYAPHALDLLGAWDPDRIFVIWTEPSALRALAADPVWRQLRAVREGRLFHPDNREWDPWGPLGRTHMIRGLLRYFRGSRRFV